MGWSGYGDDSRTAAAELLAKARAGDQSAAAQLQQATQTWAPNHRNAAIDAWNELNPGSEGDLGHIKNPHGFLGDFGKTLGSILKVAAPIAGMAIPGLGTLGAMAVGGLGSAAGGALHGDKFNLGKTLMAGGAAAGGNRLLGNGLGGMPSGAAGGGNLSIGGNQTQSGGGMAAPGAAAPGGGGGGIMDKLGGMFKGADGNVDINKIMTMAGGVGGFFDARNQAKQGAAFNNAQLDLRKQQLAQAQQDYASRAPLRNTAISRLGQMASQPMGSSVFRRPA